MNNGLRTLDGEVLRFCLVGGAATLAYIALANACAYGLGWNQVTSNAVASAASILLSYVGHNHYTFGRRGDHDLLFPRFLASTALLFALSSGISALLGDALGVEPALTAMVVAAVYPVGSFVINRSWTFRPEAASEAGGDAGWRSARRLFAPLALLAGTLAAVTLLGADRLDPANLAWMSGDSLTGYLGWAFLRQEAAWQFPPTWTSLLGHPLGLSSSFTDNVPLVAVPMRLLASVLPEPFQYLGLVLVANMVLQAYFGFKLCHRLTGGDRAASALGGLFFLLAPALLFRLYGHTALSSHWILLAALDAYLRVDPGAGLRWAPRFLVLVALAGAVNPYIGVLTLLTALAGCLRAVLERRSPAWQAALAGAACVAVLGAALSAFGFLVGGDRSTYAGAGYGVLSMNLLAPVNPMEWGAAFLPELPRAFYGQYEGYTYLGAGVLLLLAALAARAGAVLPLLRGRSAAVLPLAGLALLCTGLAASTRVTLGPLVLTGWTPPDALAFAFHAFRCSGRLFWPAYYLVFLVAVAGTARGWGPGRREIILALALCLQIADAVALRDTGSRTIAPPPVTLAPLAAPEWRTLGRDHRHLVVLPAWQCSAAATPGGESGFGLFGLLAAEQRMTINSYYAGRVSDAALAEHCTRIPARVLAEGLDPAAAYVVDRRTFTALGLRGVASHHCRPVDGFILCTGEPGGRGMHPSWREELPSLAPPAELAVGQGTAGAALLVAGWSAPEPRGVWSDGEEAQIALRPDGHPGRDLELTAVLEAFLPPGGHQGVTVLANGREVARWDFGTPATTERSARIPAELIPPEAPVLHVRFRIAAPTSPASLGASDTRRLGVALRALRIEAR